MPRGGRVVECVAAALIGRARVAEALPGYVNTTLTKEMCRDLTNSRTVL
jgi:hypothetical protein